MTSFLQFQTIEWIIPASLGNNTKGRERPAIETYTVMLMSGKKANMKLAYSFKDIAI